MLGVLTNLSERFILAYIKEAKEYDDNESQSTSSASHLDLPSPYKKRKRNSCYIEIFDTSNVTNNQYSALKSIKPIDFACLFISYWLSNCSTKELFNVQTNREQREKQDPYNWTYFSSFYNSQEHLREIFDKANKNGDENLGMFLEQMNAVCETVGERAEFIRNKLLSEFSSFGRFESPAIRFEYDSMYA